MMTEMASGMTTTLQWANTSPELQWCHWAVLRDQLLAVNGPGEVVLLCHARMIFMGLRRWRALDRCLAASCAMTGLTIAIDQAVRWFLNH
jgi:hypothetical protein